MFPSGALTHIYRELLSPCFCYPNSNRCTYNVITLVGWLVDKAYCPHSAYRKMAVSATFFPLCWIPQFVRPNICWLVRSVSVNIPHLYKNVYRLPNKYPVIVCRWCVDEAKPPRHCVYPKIRVLLHWYRSVYTERFSFDSLAKPPILQRMTNQWGRIRRPDKMCVVWHQHNRVSTVHTVCFPNFNWIEQ